VTRRFLIALLSGLAAFANAAAPVAGETLKAGVLSPVMAAPALELTGSDGKPLTLERFRGKVCCSLSASATAARFARSRWPRLRARAGSWAADAAAVQVVYVTVDPERDDAAQMRKFLGSFDPTFIGGVGSRAEIDVAQQSFGISSTRKGQRRRQLHHRSFVVYLHDRSLRRSARRHAVWTSCRRLRA
jgi:protein SCO1/2